MRARRRLDMAQVTPAKVLLHLSLSFGNEEWDELCAEHLRSYLWRSDLSSQ